MALTKQDLQAIGALLEPIRADINELKADLETVKSKQDTLSSDIVHLNHTVEPQLKIIREGIDILQDRSRQSGRLESKVEDYGHRIWALEQVVKVK